MLAFAGHPIPDRVRNAVSTQQKLRSSKVGINWEAPESGLETFVIDRGTSQPRNHHSEILIPFHNKPTMEFSTPQEAPAVNIHAPFSRAERMDQLAEIDRVRNPREPHSVISINCT